MTTYFQRLWADPARPNRERKRLLAHIIEDATFLKLTSHGTTRIHVRFKGGRIATLETQNPRSSALQVTTPPTIVALVDQLLDDHIYAEIAELLNARSTSGSRHAHANGGGEASRHSRIHRRPMEKVRHHSRACVQRPRVALRGSWAESCRFSAGRDPAFSKPFPPELFPRLIAPESPSGCRNQPVAV
jgi:hypothetical protein